MSNNKTTIDDIKVFMNDFLDRSKYAKEELCKDDAMTDNPPMFFIGYESDDSNPAHDVCLEGQKEMELSKPYQVALLPLIHKSDPLEAYQDIVRAMPIERFEFIMLVLEGYVREAGKDGKAPSDYKAGEMEKDYKENPFSDVREAIIISAVDWDMNTMFTMQCSYKYNDVGVPVWDEPICGEIEINEESSEVGFGRYGDELVGTVHYMHLATKALAYKNIFDKAPREKD